MGIKEELEALRKQQRVTNANTKEKVAAQPAPTAAGKGGVSTSKVATSKEQGLK